MVGLALLVLGGPVSPAAAQTGTCSVLDDLAREFSFENYTLSDFPSGIDACFADEQPGGLKITYVTLIEYGSEAEARVDYDSFVADGMEAFDIGDIGRSRQDQNVPTGDHEVEFVQGKYLVRTHDTLDYFRAVELARALERHLPGGSSGGSPSNQSASPTGGSPFGDDDGPPVGPIVVVAGVGAAAATAAHRSRRRNGDPDSDDTNESPECQELGARRPALDAAIDELERRVGEHARRLANLAADEQMVVDLERNIAAMTAPASGGSSWGDWSTEATRYGNATGVPGLVDEFLSLRGVGNLRGWITTTGTYAGRFLGVVGLAANWLERGSRVSHAESVRRASELNRRVDLIRGHMDERSDQLAKTGTELAADRTGLIEKIDGWNNEQSELGCSGSPLDAGRLTPKEPTKPPAANVPPLLFENDLRDYECSNLAEEVAEHNRHVRDSTPEHERRLEKSLDLSSKVTALSMFSSDVSSQWRDLDRKISAEWRSWDDGMDIGDILNIGGLGAAMFTGPWAAVAGVAIGVVNLGNSATAASGPDDTLLRLRGVYQAYQTRIRTHIARLKQQQKINDAEIFRVYEPIRTNALNLWRKKKVCFFYLSGQAAPLPKAEVLEQPASWPEINARAITHLNNGGKMPLSAEQINALMRAVDTW